MNVTSILLIIACFLLGYFCLKPAILGLLKYFATVKGWFTAAPPTTATAIEPSFVYTPNPFAYLQLKLAGMHKSWTIWFNAFLAAAMPTLDYAQANLPQLQPYLPANYYGYLMLLAVVGNLVLRFKTYNSLAEKVAPNAVPPAA